MAMTEPKDLLLVNEQLRRSNRRWKLLALSACAALVLAILFGVVAAERARRQAEVAMNAEMEAREHAMRAEREARARADGALRAFHAAMAATLGQSR
jgi:hypothetical protein